jgi:hypothetical protein
MAEAGEAFGTDDLALATTLACAGFEYDLKRLNSTKAAWIFTPPASRDEEFYDLLADYESRRCTVEPWSFTIELSRMKTVLFAFLGKSPARPNASPAAASASDG